MGIQLEPTESIFGADLQLGQVVAVERYLMVSTAGQAGGCVEAAGRFVWVALVVWLELWACRRGAEWGPQCFHCGRLGEPLLTPSPPAPVLFSQGLDRWQLAAAEQLAACCKSVLLGLAAAAQQLSVEQALEAARVEEDLQIQQWGLVEGGHDIDIADLRIRVAAPSLFVRLLRHR